MISSSSSHYVHIEEVSVTRESTTWHSIQPGDAFDIKKSMIARLPGPQDEFMGNHIELVVLLQGVEIERLTESLQEYRAKFKELSRLELDRHSYEVQIKELADRLMATREMTAENIKLKEVVRVQTIQITELRRVAVVSDGSVFEKYENSLKQIDLMLAERTMLIADLDDATNRLRYLEQEYDNQRVAVRELDDYVRKSSEFEQRSAWLEQEVERLNVLLQQKNSQSRQVARDLAELRSRVAFFTQENEELTLRIQELQGAPRLTEYENQISFLTQENNGLRLRIGQFGEIEFRISEYENRIVLLEQETLRLNGVIQQKEGQNLKAAGELSELRSRIGLFNQENEQFKTRMWEMGEERELLNRRIQELSQVSMRLSQYESRITLLQQGIESLNMVVDQKNNQILYSSEELTDLRSRITFSSQENQQLTRRIQELIGDSRLSEYENRIAFLSQEIERLNVVVEQKNTQSLHTTGEITDLRSRVSYFGQENDQLSRRIQDFSDLTFKLSQYQNRIAFLSQEIERLNMVIEHKDTQSRHETGELTDLRSRITFFGQENDLLTRRINEFGDVSVKITEYDNRIYLMSQEIERLIAVIEQKNAQSRQSTGEITDLRSRIVFFGQENEQLTRRIQELSIPTKITDHDNRISILSQEIERLNTVLEQKNTQNHQTVGELNDLRSNITFFSRENQQLKHRILSSSTLIQESEQIKIQFLPLSKEVQQLRLRVSQLTQQNQQHSLRIVELTTSLSQIKSFEQQAMSYKTKLLEYEQKVVRITQEFERLNAIFQEQRIHIAQLKQINAQLEIRIREFSSLDKDNKVLGREIDRLQLLIRAQKEEISEMRLRIADESALTKRLNEQLSLLVILFAEIESLRRRVKDSEREMEDVRRSSLIPHRH